MKYSEYLVLGLAGVAVLLIVKTAGRGSGGAAAQGSAAFAVQEWADWARLTPEQYARKYPYSGGGLWE